MPDWLKNAVFYEIYPQSFQDSNGDGIGDFTGIIHRLDYIKELGCNAIWMNPCFDSPFSDAGYDVKDYYKVAPRYGTNEDLKQLFEEVHKRNMHILLDLVPGHTSIECEWFKESMKETKNEYTDRYIWTNSIWEGFDQVKNITGSIRGISDRDGSCATNFFSTQPALNYGFANPTKDWQFAPDSKEALATRHAMMDVMKFWLDLGCDGFRVDMAGSLVKDDQDGSKNVALWQDVRALLDKEYPEAAMVSEWGEPNLSLKGGFHMDFLLHFGPSRYLDLFRVENPYFSKEGKGNIKPFVDKYLEYYNSTGGKGLICIPSGNHDMPRLSPKLDQEELKIVFAFLLSMPGAPFIYYGDEIGMRYLKGLTSVEGGYDRTGSRSPMQWDDSANCGFSTADKNKLYISMDPDQKRPTVSSQMHTEGSLWKEVQKLIAIRQSHIALQSEAEISFVYVKENTYPFAYMRKCDEETVLIVINPSNQSVCCDISLTGEEDIIYQYGALPSVGSNTITMAPQSVVFYRA